MSMLDSRNSKRFLSFYTLRHTQNVCVSEWEGERESGRVRETETVEWKRNSERDKTETETER